MAVNAGQVAKLAHIDLQHFRFGVPERKTVLSELSSKTVVGRQVHRFLKNA
jgi:hypothetical protein